MKTSAYQRLSRQRPRNSKDGPSLCRILLRPAAHSMRSWRYVVPQVVLLEDSPVYPSIVAIHPLDAMRPLIVIHPACCIAESRVVGLPAKDAELASMDVYVESLAEVKKHEQLPNVKSPDRLQFPSLEW